MKTGLRAYADSEGPDQPAHPSSLIRAFTVRLQNHRILKNISIYYKGPYQVVLLRWLTWIFIVPICPEYIFFCGTAHLIQYNFNGSNQDGLFTVDDSNSFFSPYKILPISQENKYLGIVFLIHHGIVCCVYSLESHNRGDSNECTQHKIIV